MLNVFSEILASLQRILGTAGGSFPPFCSSQSIKFGATCEHGKSATSISFRNWRTYLREVSDMSDRRSNGFI
jgi:hypothetical protein